MNSTRALRIFSLLVLMLAGTGLYDKASAQPGVSISFQTFYDDLAPYGRWVRNPQFGSVWVPDVANGFQPYSTNGYWEVTEYGNTWVSDYEWGWAPFHYGRWSYDDYVGWFWVPDYEWGPAWVNWRSGGGYYGWAPLGPGVNINVSVNIPSFWWVFVPQRYITSPGWQRFCAPRNRVSHYYGQTVIINNYYRTNNRTYVYGPRREEIERVTRRNVPVRTIDASPRGRGRVIVAESGRRGDSYNSGYNGRNGRIVESDDRRGRYERPEPTRRSSRGEDYGTNDNFRREAPSNERIGRSRDNNDNARSNERIGTDRSPSPDRGGFESRSERSNERMRQPQQSRESDSRISSPERGNGGFQRGGQESRQQRSSEAPQVRENRQERMEAPRGGDRGNSGARESGGRGAGNATERSSRGPR